MINLRSLFCHHKFVKLSSLNLHRTAMAHFYALFRRQQQISNGFLRMDDMTSSFSARFYLRCPKIAFYNDNRKIILWLRKSRTYDRLMIELMINRKIFFVIWPQLSLPHWKISTLTLKAKAWTFEAKTFKHTVRAVIKILCACHNLTGQRQVTHTTRPVSRGSIIWYWPVGSNALRPRQQLWSWQKEYNTIQKKLSKFNPQK